MDPPTIEEARSAVEVARSAIEHAVETARARGPAVHDDQAFLYDLAHASAGVAMCDTALRYGEHGSDEARLANIFIGRVVAHLGAMLWSGHDRWGLSPEALTPARAFASSATAGDYLSELCELDCPAHRNDDLDAVAATFRRFADEKIAPLAADIHRDDLDIPDEIIAGVGSLGAFGLSIPEEFGGFALGTPDDYLAMVVATEELSRASLGAGGSLITRPEILARAIEIGGTADQKHRWLPRIASGETLCAVAVTEPDHGSDVAGLKVSASRTDDGYVLDGTKTWCTFAGRAGVLVVLARTNPDPDVGHRGLSLFIVEKPTDRGRRFQHEKNGGRLTGRAIPTIGYRGMHSFEVAFDHWPVPAENLVGGEDGRGRGFHLQMAGFENGRLQTAARAVGLMQRAHELARVHAADRRVFGRALAEHQLTRVKLATMAALTQICRQYSYEVARSIAIGDRDSGATGAAMAKAFACRAAEWVTREAMQIHGGYGYAEEYEVSRLFVDARVLSIFEGSDETLCLRLIARRLLG